MPDATKTARTVHEHTLTCEHKHRSGQHLAIALCGQCRALREVTKVTTYDVDEQGRVIRGTRS